MEEKKKHAGGRPSKYKTVEELQVKIDEYFKSCFGPLINKQGNIVKDDNGKDVLVQVKPFTMAGLAFSLDMSRQSLINYKNRSDEFFDAIMRARRIVEVYVEERLFDRDGVNGAKFNLANNFPEWREKFEFNGNLTVDEIHNLVKDYANPQRLNHARTSICVN